MSSILQIGTWILHHDTIFKMLHRSTVISSSSFFVTLKAEESLLIPAFTLLITNISLSFIIRDIPHHAHHHLAPPPLLLLFLLPAGTSLTHGFQSLNEPLRDNCSTRVSANWHHRRRRHPRAIPSSLCQGLIEPQAAFTARLSEPVETLTTAESANFRSGSSLGCWAQRCQLQNSDVRLEAKSAWEIKRRRAWDVCSRSKLSFLSAASLMPITRLCSRKRLRCLHP